MCNYVIEKLKLNKLNKEKVLKRYELELIIQGHKGNNEISFHNWKIDFDNYLYNFGLNYYIRTDKAMDKSYNPKTIPMALCNIKKVYNNNFNGEIIGIRFINKKRQYQENCYTCIDYYFN